MTLQLQANLEIARKGGLSAVGLALLTGCAFAIVGLLTNLRGFAEAVLPHILVGDEGIEFQDVIDGRPIPHLLDWSYVKIGLLAAVRDLSPLALTASACVIFCSLLLLCICVINPTFKVLSRSQPTAPQTDVVTGTDPEPLTAVLTHIHVDRVHLDQALRITLIAGLPVLAIWLMTGGFGNTPLPLFANGSALTLDRNELTRLLALGIAMFAGYSPAGLAGKFGILHQAYQSDDAPTPGRQPLHIVALLPSLAAGLLFGASIFCLSRLTLGPPSGSLMAQVHTLGSINKDHFDALFHPYLLSVGLGYFASGVLLYLLGSQRISATARMGLLAVPLLMVVILAGIKRQVAHAAVAAKYDATDTVLSCAQSYDPKVGTNGVPSGKQAGAELAKRVPIQTIDSSDAVTRDLIVFHPAGVFQVAVAGVTDDGLLSERTHVPDVLAYLKRKNYQTALSWVAIKYLFNEANTRLDTSAAIRAGLLDLERCPHLRNTGETVRSMLALCEASPENLALLDEYADESRFSHPTRASQRMMGTLYNRFGEVTKAISWYKKADMPKSFLDKVLSERPLYHSGTVTGRLMWNGTPIAGAYVGVAPQRLNGLPKDLEPALLTYDRELVSVGPDPSPFYTPYHPRPYHLRWIAGGTQTRADGTFEIQHLTEGQYYLVCSLPPTIKLEVPLDQRLQVAHTPPAFTINYDLPKQQLGDISMRLQPLAKLHP